MIKEITAEGTETPKQSWPLKEGINKIGRLSDDHPQPAPSELLLQTQDTSIHRQYHCVIEVIANGNDYDYILSPFETATNPTYLGRERSLMHPLDAVYLNDSLPFYIGQDTVLMLAK
jgi:hypothetical protein